MKTQHTLSISQIKSIADHYYYLCCYGPTTLWTMYDKTLTFLRALLAKNNELKADDTVTFKWKFYGISKEYREDMNI